MRALVTPRDHRCLILPPPSTGIARPTSHQFTPRSRYASELAAHERWWDAIVSQIRAKGQTVWIEPEHGPAPYLQSLPYTNVPVADLWQVNTWIGERLMKRYAV